MVKYLESERNDMARRLWLWIHLN